MELPRDDNNTPLQLMPTGTALVTTVDTTISSSTEITLNASTRLLRVYARAQDIYMKWGTADATTSSFDEVIPAGSILDFKVDRNSFTAVNFIEAAASATLICIEKA